MNVLGRHINHPVQRGRPSSDLHTHTHLESETTCRDWHRPRRNKRCSAPSPVLCDRRVHRSCRYTSALYVSNQNAYRSIPPAMLWEAARPASFRCKRRRFRRHQQRSFWRVFSLFLSPMYATRRLEIISGLSWLSMLVDCLYWSYAGTPWVIFERKVVD